LSFTTVSPKTEKQETGLVSYLLSSDKNVSPFCPTEHLGLKGLLISLKGLSVWSCTPSYYQPSCFSKTCTSHFALCSLPSPHSFFISQHLLAPPHEAGCLWGPHKAIYESLLYPSSPFIANSWLTTTITMSLCTLQNWVVPNRHRDKFWRRLIKYELQREKSSYRFRELNMWPRTCEQVILWLKNAHLSMAVCSRYGDKDKPRMAARTLGLLPLHQPKKDPKTAPDTICNQDLTPSDLFFPLLEIRVYDTEVQHLLPYVLHPFFIS